MAPRDYIKIREIGSGSFGCAYLVRKRGEDRELVLKEIFLKNCDTLEQKKNEVEVQVLSSLNHPNVVKYRESFTQDATLCIVMDYCDGGDLRQYITSSRRRRERIPEPQVLRWFTELCLALKHMHDKKILHRDVKSPNIFLAQREYGEGLTAKLADFGIAKILKANESFTKTRIGTPYYLSPEICNEKPYSSPSDIWSLACVLHEMCALRLPFEANDIHTLVVKIVTGALPKLPAKHYSGELVRVGTEMFVRDPAERPSAAALLQKPLLQKEIKNMIEEMHSAGKSPQPPRLSRSGSSGNVAIVPRPPMGDNFVRVPGSRPCSRGPANRAGSVVGSRPSSLEPSPGSRPCSRGPANRAGSVVGSRPSSLEPSSAVRSRPAFRDSSESRSRANSRTASPIARMVTTQEILQPRRAPSPGTARGASPSRRNSDW
eukprot:TRINITY_DN7033_c0_g1_i1.p1 TRINITY_DN7033_c0_g1~~TRINITY_DN7033_c0_g1_i1.p1  ORF type:complete len:489 (-),score=68.31 TRINITY_DN7033_c0_g1_i1:250-1545(-)